MKTNKKGQMGVVGLTVGLVVGIILLIAVLVPIITSTVSTAGNTAAYLGNSYNTTTYYQTGFTGTSKVITDNLTTFVLLGTLVLVAGVAIYGMSRQ